MTKGKDRESISVRLATALSHEHAGHVDLVEELEVYIKKYPDDNWAAGQLRWSKKRITQLEKALGLAKNRRER